MKESEQEKRDNRLTVIGLAFELAMALQEQYKEKTISEYMRDIADRYDITPPITVKEFEYVVRMHGYRMAPCGQGVNVIFVGGELRNRKIQKKK